MSSRLNEHLKGGCDWKGSENLHVDKDFGNDTGLIIL